MNKNIRESIAILKPESIREILNSTDKDRIILSLKESGFIRSSSDGIDEKILRDAIIEQQDHYEKHFVTKFKINRVKVINKTMPMHIWLSEHQAVFSFSNINENFSEFGFKTSDPVLMKTIESIWQNIN